MTNRLLRHKPSGVLYVYQDVFAQRPDFEEIIDVEAKVIDEPIKKPRLKKVEPLPAVDNDALAAQAGRSVL